MNRIVPLAAAALSASAALLPALTVAQQPVAISATREDAWQFGAFLYGFYPNIGGSATFPNGQTADITIDANKVIDALKFGALGSFEARKGNWGVFTDVMYLDVGQSKSNIHDLSIGNVGLPADVAMNASFDLKAVVWTLAGTYRALEGTAAVVDLFAGARLLDIKETLNWTLSGNIGQIPAQGRAGDQDIKEHNIDGIVGVKGRAAFGTDLRWFVPYYGDVGTGDSDLTWQVMAGLGYAFNWGEVIGGYRYLDYGFKTDAKIDTMTLDGPVLGVAFHW